jgi:hypothetical protein
VCIPTPAVCTSDCTFDHRANLIGPTEKEKDIWFRIQLGGGVLQMIHAIAYASKTVPTKDHMLLSFPIGPGTVPKGVMYRPGLISWTSSGLPSTDRLRLRVSCVPSSVTAGGQQLPRRNLGRGHSRGDIVEEAEASAGGWWTSNPENGVAVATHSQLTGSRCGCAPGLQGLARARRGSPAVRPASCCGAQLPRTGCNSHPYLLNASSARPVLFRSHRIRRRHRSKRAPSSEV